MNADKLDDSVLNMFHSIRKDCNKIIHEISCIPDPKARLQHFHDQLKRYLPTLLKICPQAADADSKPGLSSNTFSNKNGSESSGKIPPVLGCDIGNGFGFVSLLVNPVYDPVSLFPAKYRMSKTGMPAAAYVTPPAGKPIEVFTNGHTAEYIHRKDPAHFVHSIKTIMEEENIQLPDITTPVSTDDVYSALVRDLVKIANEERATSHQPPVYDLVYTFPAEFSKKPYLLNRMTRSIERVELDGHHLHVVGILPEPAAAAIDYLHCKQYDSDDEKQIFLHKSYTALVYDLGHGTFDTAVVTARKYGKPYDLHLFDGVQIGGQNFDQVIYQEFTRILEQEYHYTPKTIRIRHQILKEAIDAKLCLSDSQCDIARQSLDLDNSDESYPLEISRSRFEELSRPLLEETLQCVQNVYKQATEQNVKIDAVILSGGASQMPMVKKALEQLFQEKHIPVIFHRPHMAVSYGAARFARGLAERNAKGHNEQTNLVLTQPINFPYGILQDDESPSGGKVVFMLKPTSPNKLPADSDFITKNSGNGVVPVWVYRGSRSDKGDTAPKRHCDEVLRFKFITPPHQELRIRITMEEDYNIRVTCQTPDGKSIVKSTADSVEDLLN